MILLDLSLLRRSDELITQDSNQQRLISLPETVKTASILASRSDGVKSVGFGTLDIASLSFFDSFHPLNYPFNDMTAQGPPNFCTTLLLISIASSPQVPDGRLYSSDLEPFLTS